MTPDSPRARILAVDDELQILRAVRVILRSAGYEVLTAVTMEEALDQAASSRIDAALVDLLLPDGDGIELTTRLRTWSTMPLIMLSAVGEEEEKIRALSAGADDYITKPFGPRELVARIEAVLRRASSERGSGSGSGTVAAAGLEVDVVAHIVRRDGKEVHLTPTEFALLRVLMTNPGRLMTHRSLLVEGWGPDHAEDVAVLRGQIANLRRKLEPSTSPPRRYIRTEPGIGYRFDPKWRPGRLAPTAAGSPTRRT
jgi:two-component system KDP operon response regulator KdpE